MKLAKSQSGSARTPGGTRIRCAEEAANTRRRGSRVKFCSFKPPYATVDSDAGGTCSCTRFASGKVTRGTSAKRRASSVT